MHDSGSRIWLSPPHMGGTELDYINDAFKKNWIAPLGDNVLGLEEKLEHYLESNSHVAALNSGTSALHLALLLLGIKEGDEVLCQSFTFAASVNPVRYVGATPVFIDSEPESWNICPVQLETAIKARISVGKKPAAIIAVHLYGMPYKVNDVNAVAERYNIPIIEDAAEALGSTIDGKKCGTLGTFGVLSFNGNKIITTSGGGAIVCKAPELKEKAVFLATQARDAASHYQHSVLGYNYRMSNISAGIGCGQMEVLPLRLQQKNELHQKYISFFKSIPGVKVFTNYNSNVSSNHWLTCITISDTQSTGKSTEELRQVLDAHNIESRPLWKPMHLQPLYKGYLYFGSKVCQRLFETGLCLPSGTGMDEEQILRIFTCLKGYFGDIN
ncbi:DegT/DnrJ/EryC1/StrS family aminotransferase [Flavobacterium sp. RNTU_13]|uniref:DegT/DnrJ/EryC1/StrS family aminotransferase n=1 Tax=Flavobacterium sp. RNTU_13 TaxID=3375145 RepID=UPI003985EF6A